MSSKVGLLVLAALLVLLPWALWRIEALRRVAPLAVIQIMAGIAFGPSLFGRLAPEWHAAVFTPPVLVSVQGLSAIGVLLFVFVSGMHLDLGQLRGRVRGLAGLAIGSFVLPACLGVALGWWVAFAVPDALGARGGVVPFVVAFSVCIAVTALPVLAAILKEMGLIGTRLGQTALALAALNDAALWLVLAVLLTLVAEDGAGLLDIAVACLIWSATLLFVLRPALVYIARAEARRHWLLPLGIAIMLGAAASAEEIGIGYIIGGFAAGLIIPSEARAALIREIEPLTVTLLLPFFFMSSGLKAMVDPSSASFLTVTILATAATILGKVAGVALPARQAGWTWRDAAAMGTLMQTKGLMEVVVLAVLHDAGLMGTTVFSALVMMAVICTLVTAPLTRALVLREQRVPSAAERQV
jgi:Kef-type K+ transport system membrane component KefB